MMMNVITPDVQVVGLRYGDDEEVHLVDNQLLRADLLERATEDVRQTYGRLRTSLRAFKEFDDVPAVRRHFADLIEKHRIAELALNFLVHKGIPVQAIRDNWFKQEGDLLKSMPTYIDTKPNYTAIHEALQMHKRLHRIDE